MDVRGCFVVSGHLLLLLGLTACGGGITNTRPLATAIKTPTSASSSTGASSSANLGNLPGAAPSDPSGNTGSTSSVSADPLTFGTHFSSGANHACMISSAGKTYCWGLGTAYALGNGAATNRTAPLAVDMSGLDSELYFVQIAAGATHTCALGNDRKVYCWGSGGAPLGQTTNTGRLLKPTAIDESNLEDGESFSQIYTGGDHSCGLTSAHRTYCWGKNGAGEIGDGTKVNRLTPTLVVQTALGSGAYFAQLALGDSFSCGLSSDGKIYCWGDDAQGTLGGTQINHNQSVPTPVSLAHVAAGTLFTQIDSGPAHSCAVSSQGEAYCWGANTDGQLGTSNLVAETAPRLVDVTALGADSRFAQITVGDAHSCALTQGGRSFCWGDDTAGQIGDAKKSGQRTSPTAVDTSALANGTHFVALAAGGNHSCGIASDGKYYCWGINTYGQLGTGDKVLQMKPVAVNLPQ